MNICLVTSSVVKFHGAFDMGCKKAEYNNLIAKVYESTLASWVSLVLLLMSNVLFCSFVSSNHRCKCVVGGCLIPPCGVSCHLDLTSHVQGYYMILQSGP